MMPVFASCQNILNVEAHLHPPRGTQFGPAARPSAVLQPQVQLSTACCCNLGGWAPLPCWASGTAASRPGLARPTACRRSWTPFGPCTINAVSVMSVMLKQVNSSPCWCRTSRERPDPCDASQLDTILHGDAYPAIHNSLGDLHSLPHQPRA